MKKMDLAFFWNTDFNPIYLCWIKETFEIRVLINIYLRNI
jgi:hypothetical protein